MSDPLVHSYSVIRTSSNEVMPRPFLPLSLSSQTRRVQVDGLLDTGADVNVIPFEIGLELGFRWEDARSGLQLSGNLHTHETRAILERIWNVNFGLSHPRKLAFTPLALRERGWG
jgi:hypothetical protein